MKISKKRAYEKLKYLMPDASDEEINEIMNGDYSYKESESDVMIKKELKKIAILFLIVITILCGGVLGAGFIQNKLITALRTLPLLVICIGTLFAKIAKSYVNWVEYGDY